MKEKRDAFLIGMIALFFFLSAYVFDIYHEGLVKTGNTFGVSYMTMNNPFYTVIENELEKQVEGNQDRMILRDPVLDANRQIEQIEEFIEMDVDGLFVNPVDSAAIIPVLTKAAQAGIPVIVIDSPIQNAGAVNCSVVSDNYEAGRLCALDLMAAKESAKIALLKHSGVISGADRIQGFLDALKEHPEYEVVDEAECAGQTETAMPAMVEMLERHPEIDTIMCLNDPSAIGALAAMDFKNRNDIRVYGVDGTPEFKTLISEHPENRITVAQSPYQMARKAAETMYRILDGQKCDPEIIIPVRLLDAHNIHETQTGGWQ